MPLSEHLAEILDHYEPQTPSLMDDPRTQPDPPQCMSCRRLFAEDELDKAGLCPRCAKEHAQGYRVQTLAGRCANGAERDHGVVRHAVPLDSWTALCGAKPGRLSAGWSDYGRGEEVTCQRCLRKLDLQASSD